MKKSFFHVLVLGLVMLAAVGSPAARGDDFSYLTLRGLNTMTISFKGFKDDLQRFGVDEAKLRVMVENRLQNAGIRIVTAEQALKDPAAAQMLVDLHVNVSDYHYYSYSLVLKVNEKVPLPGQNRGFVSQTVWSKGTYGTVLDTSLLRISDDLGELTGHFVSDHMHENAVATE